MQNIKNFKLAAPAQELVKFKPDYAAMPQLESEDGRDWYAWQSSFADDTIKIMYDANGVIRSVVDKPVLQRGNIYAVSMFFPENMSVAEISQADWPDNFELNDGWAFDGVEVFRQPQTKPASIPNPEIEALRLEVAELREMVEKN